MSGCHWKILSWKIIQCVGLPQLHRPRSIPFTGFSVTIFHNNYSYGI